MGKIEEYYENTKNALPHDSVKKFIKDNSKAGKAIDLGCGAGRDTVFLIKNNWNVIAIDRENTRNIIEKNFNEEEQKRFKFSCQSFEKIELERNDLIIAYNSIPFCSKNYFNEFWNKIVSSINEEGYFIGNFFGLNDSWNKIKPKMTFLSKGEVLDLFKNFEIISFEEKEWDGKTGLGIMKHWHTYQVVAKKVNSL